MGNDDSFIEAGPVRPSRKVDRRARLAEAIGYFHASTDLSIQSIDDNARTKILRTFTVCSPHRRLCRRTAAQCRGLASYDNAQAESFMQDVQRDLDSPSNTARLPIHFPTLTSRGKA